VALPGLVVCWFVMYLDGTWTLNLRVLAADWPQKYICIMQAEVHQIRYNHLKLYSE
jgi:hypothetical protein